MKIVDLTNSSSKDIVAEDIPEGTVFRCTTPNNGVFLRVYKYIVDLSDPRLTWHLNVQVSGYCPVKATLTIEDLYPSAVIGGPR